MKLFFIVRTDAGADDGLQRVFGVYNTPELATAEMNKIANHMRGEFAVYSGAPVEVEN